MTFSRWALLLLLAPALLVVAVGLALPIAWLFRFSLMLSDTGMVTDRGPLIANYARLYGDGFHLWVFAKTLMLSLCVTLLALLLGYPLAHAIWKAPARWRGAMTIAVLSPLLVSIVVSSYGWLVILGSNGLVNRALIALGLTTAPLKLIYTEGAIVLGLTHIVLPFVVLSVLAALERIDGRFAEAAAVLGADRLAVLRHVTLPLALPGLIAGTTLAFSIAVSAYVTPAVLGPSGPNFIATSIYNEFVTLFDWGMGAAMAVTLLVVGLGLVFMFLRLAYRFGGVAAAGRA
jgi:putative spermidine/putrescine transport system permease protein